MVKVAPISPSTEETQSQGKEDDARTLPSGKEDIRTLPSGKEDIRTLPSGKEDVRTLPSGKGDPPDPDDKSKTDTFESGGPTNSRKILTAKRNAKPDNLTPQNLSYKNPKEFLKAYCESMCCYDLTNRARIEVRSNNEKMVVCSGNVISFRQSLGTHGTKEQLEHYLRAYSRFFRKTGIQLKNVPEKMWMSILEYLSLEDLKNFRQASSVTNALVERTYKWADDVCFVYDERKKVYRECPPEQICEDKTVGWPAMRLKNCSKVSLAFWKDLNVPKSITMLHLHDCSLSGTVLVTLLANMWKLHEFNFTLSPNRIDHHKIQKKLEEFYDTRRSMKKVSLRDEKSEFARNIKKRHLRYDKSKSADTLKFSDLLPKIRRITLQAASLSIINIVLDILEEIVCSSLEELRIHCRMEMSFIPYAAEVMLDKKTPNKTNRPSKSKTKKSIKAVEKKVQIRAKKLMENNQTTLSCLEITLNSGDVNEEFEEFAELQGRPTIIMIAHLFDDSNYPRLCLKELTIDFPNLLPAINHHNSENVNDGCAYCGFRQLVEFCGAQIDLEKLVIRRIHSSASTKPLLKILKKSTKHAKVYLWGTIYPGHLEVERDDIALMLETVDMQLGGNDCMEVYMDYLMKDKAMENTKRLEIRSESKWLTSYKIGLIGMKFPNITRLVLADTRMRTDGLYSAPEVNDEDLQNIIACLPQLVELIIRANMMRVTDFGFTGFAVELQKKSKNIQNNSSKLKKFYSDAYNDYLSYKYSINELESKKIPASQEADQLYPKPEE